MLTLLLLPVNQLLFITSTQYTGRALIKSGAPGKLTGCEVNLVHLVRASRGKFYLKRISVQKILPACENWLPSC